MITIRPDGLVSLCCSDAYGEVTLGDANNQGLIEIWESDKYREYRRIFSAIPLTVLLIPASTQVIGTLINAINRKWGHLPVNQRR